MKKAGLVFCVVVMVGALLAGCGEKTPSAVRVGVIAELTGDMPAVGESCRKAAELAVKQMNDAGGLKVGDKQYKVELFVEDNAGKADQSASAAQKLITQKKVVAIVGPNATRYAIPASEIAESSKVLLITPWSTNPRTTLDAKTGAPKKYVFRACFIDPFQGRVLARFAMTALKRAGRPCFTMSPPTTTRASRRFSRRRSSRTGARSWPSRRTPRTTGIFPRSSPR